MANATDHQRDRVRRHVFPGQRLVGFLFASQRIRSQSRTVEHWIILPASISKIDTRLCHRPGFRRYTHGPLGHRSQLVHDRFRRQHLPSRLVETISLR